MSGAVKTRPWAKADCGLGRTPRFGHQPPIGVEGNPSQGYDDANSGKRIDLGL